MASGDLAATAILRTVFELPSVTRWVAMVQKEVGERLAAARDVAIRTLGGKRLLARQDWIYDWTAPQ